MSSMPFLTQKEAYDVSDAILVTLYGTDTFKRWRDLKYRMKFHSEHEYVNWLMDVADQYTVEVEEGDGEGAAEFEAEEEGVAAAEPYQEYGVKTEDSKPPVVHPASVHLTRQQQQQQHAVKVEGSGGEGQYMHSAGVEETASGVGAQAGMVTPSRTRRQQQHQQHQPQTEEITVSDDGGDEYNNLAYDDSMSAAGGEPPPVEGDVSSLFDGSSVADQSVGEYSGGGGAGMPQQLTPGGTPAGTPSGGTSGGKMYTGVHHCPFCIYATSQRPNLSRHVASVHRRQKDHRCTYCAYTCSRGDALQRHMINRHRSHSQYQCPRCEKPFAAPYALRTHMAHCKGTGTTGDGTNAAGRQPGTATGAPPTADGFTVDSLIQFDADMKPPAPAGLQLPPAPPDFRARVPPHQKKA